MTKLIVLDSDTCDMLIEERKRKGHDRYDEVWEGVYVMPSLPSNVHQEIVSNLDAIFSEVVRREGRGKNYPGVNVSDRRGNWKENYRCPDVAVILKGGRAIDCDTYYFGGPDFVVEIESPGEDPEEKVPFYSKVGVREFLILHRDTRALRLLRHDGNELIPVDPSSFEGKQWLVSAVLPLAFRRKASKGGAVVEVRRTDGQPGAWSV